VLIRLVDNLFLAPLRLCVSAFKPMMKNAKTQRRQASGVFWRVLRCFRWNDSAGKLQIPSSKLQAPEKFQASNLNASPLDGDHIAQPLVWSLRFGASLELGVWGLVFGAWCFGARRIPSKTARNSWTGSIAVASKEFIGAIEEATVPRRRFETGPQDSDAWALRESASRKRVPK
jgi:hypothetical protein